MVTRRLAEVYSHVYIDEVQDLAGWDHNFVEHMLRADIAVHMVGDPRQRTYSTNNSTKNKIKGSTPLTVMREKFEKLGLITVDVHNVSYRSHQSICDFADRLYPDLLATRSMSESTEEHLGVFSVSWSQARTYATRFTTSNLRYNSTSDTQGLPAFNFGESKGSTFDRVLIFPAKTMDTYLRRGGGLAEGTRSKLYVALTRARYSVAVVIPDNKTALPNTTLWI